MSEVTTPAGAVEIAARTEARIFDSEDPEQEAPNAIKAALHEAVAPFVELLAELEIPMSEGFDDNALSLKRAQLLTLWSKS